MTGDQNAPYSRLKIRKTPTPLTQNACVQIDNTVHKNNGHWTHAMRAWHTHTLYIVCVGKSQFSVSHFSLSTHQFTYPRRRFFFYVLRINNILHSIKLTLSWKSDFQVYDNCLKMAPKERNIAMMGYRSVGKCVIFIVVILIE